MGELLVSLLVLPVALYVTLPSGPIFSASAPADDPGAVVYEYYRFEFDSPAERSIVEPDLQRALETYEELRHVDIAGIFAVAGNPNATVIGVWVPEADRDRVVDVFRSCFTNPPIDARKTKLGEINEVD